MTHQQMLNERKALILGCDATKFRLPSSLPSTKALAETLPGRLFITVYCFRTCRFVEHRGVEKLTGYRAQEFTIEELYRTIIHPADKEGVLRANQVAYRILTQPGFSFEVLRDCFQCNFRILTKKEGYLPILRSCYIYAIEQGKLSLQIDFWNVLPTIGYVSTVRPIFSASERQTEIFNLFYEENIKMLGGFHFTRRELQILDAKSNGCSDKEVASLLKTYPKNVQNHLANMREKASLFLESHNKEPLVRDTNELLRFSSDYGLLPVPAKLLES